MNLNIKVPFILMGSLEIVFSVILAVLTLILGFYVFSWFTKDYNDLEEIKNNNIAVSILTATFLICIGLALQTAAGPASSMLREAIFSIGFTIIRLLITIFFMIIHLFLAVVISMLSMFLTIFLLTRISPFKNLKAIMKNNIAVSIIISAVMFVTILLIRDPLLFFLEGMMVKIILIK